MYSFESRSGGTQIEVSNIDKDGDIEINMDCDGQGALIYLPRKEVVKLINHLIQTCEITQDEIV